MKVTKLTSNSFGYHRNHDNLLTSEDDSYNPMDFHLDQNREFDLKNLKNIMNLEMNEKNSFQLTER